MIIKYTVGNNLFSFIVLYWNWFLTIKDLAWIFQRERVEPEVFGGGTEVPGGAPQDSDPGAAAGEDKIRFQVTTVQTARVELVCQGQ